MIALADNQMLRSIRNITGREVDLYLIEKWFAERDKIRKLKSSLENRDRIQRLQNNINNMLYIPEYITIVMEHSAHYRYLFKNGLMLNGKKYVRFSCSASQARVSTVVFCDESIAEELDKILSNGRNLDKEITPSKYNAYYGLAGSSTEVVSDPKFCIVPDYYSKTKLKVNFVTETDWQEDDLIEIKEIEHNFNRFDGQGLISYKKAKEWANELRLDYVPAQWCIRQNFLKGMLCTFPIHEFCEKVNGGSYIVKTLYGKEVDLRDVDVIISESMFKLWDSFDSQEQYEENCKKNNLSWGVTLYTPKQDKDILTMNYQFLQTLNLNKSDIKELCKKFVDWVEGVTYDNIYYTFLFLLGKNVDEEKIKNFLSSSEKYWLKSLIINHNLLNDRHIRKKVYNLIRIMIRRACLGDIIVDGNFQVLVSDPYAMMQHICGLEVTGLLDKKEYYSNYWNNKDKTLVNSMRAPLTYRSEHVKLNLVNREELSYWYRYCYTGVIVNVFGAETLHWAGSDWDYDQIATTCNPIILKGVYENELPVVYEPPKAKKKKITSEDLYKADLFAFGSIIGSITNKSTTGYSILSQFDKDSEEYRRTINRLQMCTKLQSAQIDKAKIGRNVKGIPDKWVKYNKIVSADSEEEKKEKMINNNTLLNKHPYFFVYLYRNTRNKYRRYVERHDVSCNYGFEKTDDFLDLYYRYMPVVYSDCVMNNLCRYIESIDFNIINKVRKKYDKNIYKLYLADNVDFDESTYKLVKKKCIEFNRALRGFTNKRVYKKHQNDRYFELLPVNRGNYFKNTMDSLVSNVYELVNYLVLVFYKDYPSLNKDLLWNMYGKYIFNNIKSKNGNSIKFPIVDSSGDITYLNNTYLVKDVTI